MQNAFHDKFEILEKDLLGRIGILETNHGKIETPTLAPVINISKILFPPKDIVEMGFPLLMTNSYLIKRNYDNIGIEAGVHKLLGVNTPVMTDSGAYQLMIYGNVEITPKEIVEYQVNIGSDIGVILDIPTKYDTPYYIVKEEVKETIRRAIEASKIDRKNMLLVGPIQGGRYLNLVAYSANEMSKLNFDLYAVGGPTQIMENYKFTDLVRLVMTAKMNLPIGAPLHLFGAGHPFLIPLIVAMGVDMFDSSSYILYARDLRYITSTRTLRFHDMRNLPCNCPICSKWTHNEMKKLPRQKLVKLIAIHNLYALSEEIKRTKEAIHEGRLWELVEMKAKSHPSLQNAFLEFRKYTSFIEKYHPDIRGALHGLFFYSAISRYRPEVIRYLKKLKDNYKPPPKKILLLIKESEQKPFTRGGFISDIYSHIYSNKKLSKKIHIAVLSSAYSIIPLELDGFYPLSQYETSYNILETAYHEITSDVVWYIVNKGYSTIILIYDVLPPEMVEELKYKLHERGIKIFFFKTLYQGKEADKVISYINSISQNLNIQ